MVKNNSNYNNNKNVLLIWSVQFMEMLPRGKQTEEGWEPLVYSLKREREVHEYIVWKEGDKDVHEKTASNLYYCPKVKDHLLKLLSKNIVQPISENQY